MRQRHVETTRRVCNRYKAGYERYLQADDDARAEEAAETALGSTGDLDTGISQDAVNAVNDPEDESDFGSDVESGEDRA